MKAISFGFLTTSEVLESGLGQSFRPHLHLYLASLIPDVNGAINFSQDKDFAILRTKTDVFLQFAILTL